jgi:hypothetical protein
MQADNTISGRINWLNFRGYNIYRNNERLNEDIVTDTEYFDNIWVCDTFFYSVSAVYNSYQSCRLEPPLIVTTNNGLPPPEDFQVQLLECNYLVFSWSMPDTGSLYRNQNDDGMNKNQSSPSLKDIVIGYNFYIDNTIAGFIPGGDTFYISDPVQYSPGTYNFGLEAVYEIGESCRVSVSVIVPGIGTVLGHVFDSITYEPIPGAQVLIYPDADTMITGGDGDFEFSCVIAGLSSVTAIAEGYNAKTVQVELSHGQYLEIGFNLVPTSIGYNEICDRTFIKIYSNPSEGQLHVALSENIIKIIITDYLGKVMLEDDLSNQKELFIDISDFSHGIYLINCLTKNGNFLTKKLVLIK